MAFVTDASRFFADGLNLSAYSKQMAMQVGQDTLDTTVFTSGKNKEFIVGKQADGSFSVGGVLDTDATTALTPYRQMADWKGTETALTAALSGDTPLAEAFLLNVLTADFTSSNTIDGLGEFTLSGKTTGPQDVGVMLEEFASIAATANGDSRDLTGASTNGAVAHLHVGAFSGITDDTISIEDSSTGSSGWGTILTFAASTAAQVGQRVAITGSIKRYVRVVDTFNGSGSITRAVAFARR